ncbi:MAG TPA: NERD domain-containing protein [Chloroflexota bacterium]|nr:NERD domain-containing protein [Chloroflexota bacterium]
MTTRVVECRRPTVGLGPVPASAREAGPRRAVGVKRAALVAVVLVPLAGAAEPPQGWVLAALTALTMLLLVPIVGERAPWGWLTVLFAGAAFVTPRRQLPGLGPALFVATGVSLVLWLAGGGARGPRDGRPRPGSRERQAQLLMGLSGERHVGQVLARELPQEYVLINGLKLPRGAGDIDHLVVGPSGVFLLETKTMAGRIACDPDGRWHRTRLGRAGTPYAAYIGDPAAQVQRNIFAVRDCLRSQLPGLFRRPPLWIEGLVVFPHPRTELDAEHCRVPAMRLDQATSHICLHVPQRPLQPPEVDRVVDTLLVEGQDRTYPAVRRSQSAQALVEVALVLPIVVGLLFGTLAISRVVQAQTAVVAVAHEAARAAAMGTSPADAVVRMRQRVDLVAPGLGLDPRAVALDWDVSAFAAERGQVSATVTYRVDLGDLPVVGWVPVPTVRAQHVEWVDPFRSGLARLDGVVP